MNNNSTGKSILIVEDDALVATSLARMLRLEKFDVSICPDPNTALALCSKRQFDLIITDQMMPVMKGTEFAVLAKVKQPNAHTLLISGYINSDKANEALKSGHIQKFISKPWHNKDILNMIESEIELSRRSQF
jgi:DNA-binding NtrC family response regulator